MELTILGSGGCMAIPKPLCECRICREARYKGVPYERTGPSVYLQDANLLIDTPAEIVSQLNRTGIERVDRITFTHLDPDHIEGFRVVEQITLDFRTWKAYPEKQIQLVLPRRLYDRLGDIRSVYGPLVDYYETQGFVKCVPFETQITMGDVRMTALPVFRQEPTAYILVFEKGGKKVVYAPCDIKPFPLEEAEVRNPDLLIIQPGIFEEGLKHDFTYPDDHISRTTIYTFDQTMELADRIGAKEILFIHLEECWNKSHDDYMAIAKEHARVRFAFDGMTIRV
ncbi:MAG: hypothetical protein JRJ51_21535 [Deltaproteobacteria bacterium]|nr:hypothetical protein [Deltaproteobacteria bacterium]